MQLLAGELQNPTRRTSPFRDGSFSPLQNLNSPATEAEVRFFLKEQKRDGWWPVFQATDEEAFASTFGTAWALIGLQTQLRNRLIPKTMEEEVSSAIENGSTWLERHGSKSRWKDYPLNEKGKSSDSLSGLVMHALHLTASNSMTQLKKDWLDNLPSIPLAEDKSQNFVWSHPSWGSHQGRVRSHYTAVDVDRNSRRLPCWQYIRPYARAPLDGTSFRSGAVIHAETQVENWWRAEFLLALRYVAGDLSPGIPPKMSRLQICNRSRQLKPNCRSHLMPLR